MAECQSLRVFYFTGRGLFIDHLKASLPLRPTFCPLPLSCYNHWYGAQRTQCARLIGE